MDGRSNQYKENKSVRGGNTSIKTGNAFAGVNLFITVRCEPSILLRIVIFNLLDYIMHVLRMTYTVVGLVRFVATFSIDTTTHLQYLEK